MLGAEARGYTLSAPPEECALGGLLAHLGREHKNFQPSNAHFGLMPGFEERIAKKERKERYAERAMTSFAEWLHKENLMCNEV